MKVVGIIPAFNEEKSVGTVVREAKKHASRVIVIDDGSSDRTGAEAEKAGAEVVSHHTNRGLGITIADGYRHALKAGADVIFQIDADGQYKPDDIPKLLEPVIKGKADMVLGSRFLGGIEEMPFSKRFGNRLFSRMTSFLAGTKITDAQTGFRAMRRELLEAIVPTAGYTYTQEMIIRAAMEKFQVVEVPSYFAKRKHGKSRLIGNIFSYAINCFGIMAKTFRDYNPLWFFGSPGVVLMVGGFGVGMYVFFYFLQHGDIGGMVGRIILSALAMISGLILVFMGMFADMQQSKYIQLREHIKRLK